MSYHPEHTGDHEWFSAQLAIICGCEPESVSGDARLVDDLGLDSPAVAEFVVLVFERFGVDLAERGADWLDLSVDELYQELQRPRATPDRPTFNR